MGPVSFACAFLTWPLSPTFGFPHREFLRVTDPRGHCALFFVPSVIFLFRPLQHGNTGSVVVSFVYIHRNSFYPWSGLSLGAGGGQDIKNRAVRADSADTSGVDGAPGGLPQVAGRGRERAAGTLGHGHHSRAPGRGVGVHLDATGVEWTEGHEAMGLPRGPTGPLGQIFVLAALALAVGREVPREPR